MWSRQRTTTSHCDCACESSSGKCHSALVIRDLFPEAILAADNIVDDIDHVCQVETSIHLAARVTGARDFIRCTLPEILLGTAPARDGNGKVAVFGPFGLGVLDLAVGKLAWRSAREKTVETRLPSFFPRPWAGVLSSDLAAAKPSE